MSPKCCLCQKRKDPSEFYADSSRTGGLASRCKDCEAKRFKSRWDALPKAKYACSICGVDVEAVVCTKAAKSGKCVTCHRRSIVVPEAERQRRSQMLRDIMRKKAERNRLLLETTGRKTCRKCKESLATESFRPSKSGDGLSGYCKMCERWKNKESAYGITREMYEAIRRIQGGRCAICEKHESKARRHRDYGLVIDHDHTTGQIRGLLCNSCNNALGKLGDNSSGLIRALAYLTSREMMVHLEPSMLCLP